VAEFDSVIPPGREGKVTAQVNVSGMHGGVFQKSVTVESNSTKEPSLVLNIKGTLTPVVEVSATYLTIKCGVPLKETAPITLRTQKADLRIGDVVFEGQAGAAGGGNWRTVVPILPTFELVRTKGPDSSGVYDYTLRMAVQAELAEDANGDFKLATNHPKRTEIVIHGRIAK
jgi:hypothetical protein